MAGPTVIGPLLFDRKADSDTAKKASAQERYIVLTMDQLAARQSTDIPKEGDPHPTWTGLSLDKILTANGNDGRVYVDCYYSNDKRYVTNRTANKEAATWYHWGWGQRDVDVKIFLNVRTKVNFSEQSDPVDDYEIIDDGVRETHVIRPLTVRLSRVTDPRFLDPIAEQRNKIHRMPDGRKYLFLGGDTTQVDDTTYDVVYEWEQDKGTPMPRVTIGNSAVSIALPDGPPAPNQLLREPYCQLVPIPSNGVGVPHTTAQFSPFAEDLEGWRTLPGANRVI